MKRHVKLTIKIFVSIVFVTAILLLYNLKSVSADFGPDSSTGEGDPNCTCVAENDAKNNSINCTATCPPGSGDSCVPQTIIRGSCSTGVVCTTGKDSSGAPIPVCGGAAPGAKPITANDCWCTHTVDEQNKQLLAGVANGNPGASLEGVNGRTCTDGKTVFPDDNKFGCSINAECTPNGAATIVDPSDPSGKTKHSPGQCQPAQCDCDSMNTPGGGKNTMTCKVPGVNNATTKAAPCSLLQICTQANAGDGKASCQQLDNCKCDTPDTPGSGKNGFTCIAGANGNTSYQESCSQDSEACIQVSTDKPNGNGKIDCKDETSKLLNPTTEPTLPPPPPPPCAGTITNGKCDSFNTAFGLVSTNPSDFITKLVSIILGISGGIAVLLIILAGYRIMVSRGKPEALQQAREQLIAAIVGLLFLIFSFVILQVITTDILNLSAIK